MDGDETVVRLVGVMRLAARLDGQHLRTAQFTRAVRGATIRARPLPPQGDVRWALQVRGAPGRVDDLLLVLRAGGASVHGNVDNDLGTFDGECRLPFTLIDGHVLAGTEALRQAADAVELRFERGWMHVEAELAPPRLAAARTILESMDPSWDGRVEQALPPRNA